MAKAAAALIAVPTVRHLRDALTSFALSPDGRQLVFAAASEDLTVDGRVEGRIDLPEHTLVIGPNATINAGIVAKSVLVFGKVAGTITAHDRLDSRTGASVEGEGTCARISIQDGAGFSGKVAMGARRSKSNGADGHPTPALAAAL